MDTVKTRQLRVARAKLDLATRMNRLLYRIETMLSVYGLTFDTQDMVLAIAVLMPLINRMNEYYIAQTRELLRNMEERLDLIELIQSKGDSE